MYHVIGERFTDIDSIKKKVKLLGALWNSKVSSCIVQYSLESGNPLPKSDELNGITH